MLMGNYAWDDEVWLYTNFWEDTNCNACKPNDERWRRRGWLRYEICHLALLSCTEVNNLKEVWIFVKHNCAERFLLFWFPMTRRRCWLSFAINGMLPGCHCPTPQTVLPLRYYSQRGGDVWFGFDIYENMSFCIFIFCCVDGFQC